MLPNFILPLIGVIIVVFIAFYGFTTQGYFVHLSLLVAPIFVFLVNQPSIWFILILAVSRSGLIFPGLPQGLQVAHVLMFGLTALLFARNIIEKKSRGKRDLSDYFLIAFIAVILITAMTRGFGLRALGSGGWGGMSYIKLFITSSFLLMVKSLHITDRQFQKALYAMLVLSTLPALSQIVFTFSGGRIYHQYMFIEAYVGGLISSLQAAEGGGTIRLHMLGSVAMIVMMIGMILIPNKDIVTRTLRIMTIILAIGLAALSGFRGQIITIIGTLILITFLQGSGNYARRSMMLLGVGLVGLLLLYPMIPFLPASMQRSFSWLPFAPIPWDIKYEANYSATTRFLVWEMAWKEIPQYLLVGKGFIVNPMDVMALTVRQDWALSAFISHNYHSGPISLLLDTGLFGFLFGSLFLITTCVEMFKRLKHVVGPPILRRAYIFFLASHLFMVPSYYIIFGDVKESFPFIFVNLAVMNVLYNSALQGSRKDSSASTEEQHVPLRMSERVRVNSVYSSKRG
ncbi:MAG TPA: hypothetical protein PJ991_02490 [Kiritimatiellia bacterium]|nr:hypothetical protein [Kiritimatiellia bacterium]